MTEITDRTPVEYLNQAERLAPVPATREEATTEAWLRHFAALGLAAHAAFRAALPSIDEKAALGSRPELGYLMEIATSATAAAFALDASADTAAALIWDLTPEAGALNGEYLDWLADLVSGLGINPADLYPWFEAPDFPVAAAPAVTGEV